MTAADLKALLPKLEKFHARFHRFFCRSEGRARSRQYLIGLNLPIERKNVENIAEQVEATPRKLQEFLSDSPWDDEGCIGELQKFVGEEFGAAHGVLILDLSRHRDYPDEVAGRSVTPLWGGLRAGAMVGIITGSQGRPASRPAVGSVPAAQRLTARERAPAP